MKIGGIIGRFNPFCTNHVDLMEDTAKKVDKLVVLVGQPNFARASEVLSSSEFQEYRCKYVLPYDRIAAAISNTIKNVYTVVLPIVDILDHTKYETHVMQTLCDALISPEEVTIFGENPDTEKCFRILAYETVLLPNKAHATDARRELWRNETSDKIAMQLTHQEKRALIFAQAYLDGVEL